MRSDGLLAVIERYQAVLAALAFAVLAAVIGTSMVARGSPPPLELYHGSALAPGTPIKVHVSGAVIEPGVYELREGDRVADAIEAAGGPLDDAAIESLNLARRLRDGEQLVVPGAQRQATIISLRPGERIDINTASAALLETLPGVGPAYARRIVDSRAVDGPYARIEDLLERRVIPRSTFEGISELIAVP